MLIIRRHTVNGDLNSEECFWIDGDGVSTFDFFIPVTYVLQVYMSEKWDEKV